MTHLVLLSAADGVMTAETIVGTVVPCAVFATTFAIVVALLYYRFRTLRLRNELVALYLSRGEAVPPWLLGAPVAGRNVDLRRGLVLLAGGLGISGAGGILRHGDAAAFGIIPALIGCAFLIVWKVGASADDPTAPRSDAE